MKYYQRGAEVFAFESDGSQDKYIKPDMIAMTEEEINRHMTRNKSGPAQKNEAGWMKRQRMDEATRVIYPLQDAADLDMATEAETAQLVAWKTYRVLLNRVDISKAPDIN